MTVKKANNSCASLTPYQIVLRISSHRGHKFPPLLILLSFKTRIKLPPVQTATTRFPNVFLQLLQCSRQCPSYSAHRAALITKMELTFPAFCLSFVDFAVQFCFCSPFSISFHDKRPLDSRNNGVIFLDQPIASFCIDNR